MSTGELRSLVEVDGVRPGLLFEESFAAILALKERPRVAGGHAPARDRGPRAASRSTRGRPDRSAWPTRRAGGSAAASPTCARRPDDNGYARPVEGVDRLRRHGARRGARGRRHRRGAPSAGEPAATTPRTQARLRTDLKPLEITQPDGPELHGRGQPGALAALVAAGVDGPRRGPGPAPGRLRGRRAGAADPVPGLGERDGGPLRRPRARCTDGRTRSTPGEWGLGRMANSLTLGL